MDPYAVVIVTYNHQKTLAACLEAVARLEPPAARVLVVDNASADDSARIARAHGATTIQEEQNTGFAAAVNRGINHGAEPWVLVLNPDCAPRPDFVRELLAGAARAPTEGAIGSLTGKLLRARGPDLEATSTIDTAGMIVTSEGRHLDRGSGEEDVELYDRAAWVFGGTGAATLYRRQALDDVAYPEHEFFAESFFAYREDAELAWRLQLRGWRCIYQPGAVAAHLRGFQPEAGRAGYREINRHSVRNRFLLRLHCADAAWHLRNFPWWLVRDTLVAGACLSVERGSAGAFAELWRLRKDALRRRRWVLGRRTVPARQIQRWFRKRYQVEEIEYP